MRAITTFLCGIAVAISALAQPTPPSAHALAEQVKSQLIAVIEKKAEIEASGGAGQFYESIRGVFAPVVDYGLVTRYVMGPFYGQASDDERQRFATKLEAGLMRSVTLYAQSLAAAGDFEFVVVPPAPDAADEDRVVIGLEARRGEAVNQLRFFLYRNPEQQWKLINLVLEKANMGDLLRAQFAASMVKHNNNLAEAIDAWGG